MAELPCSMVAIHSASLWALQMNNVVLVSRRKRKNRNSMTTAGKDRTGTLFVPCRDHEIEIEVYECGE